MGIKKIQWGKNFRGTNKFREGGQHIEYLFGSEIFFIYRRIKKAKKIATQFPPISIFLPPPLNFSKHTCCAPNNSNLISVHLSIYLSQNMPISSKLLLKNKNSTHNLITISTVFTNKNGMDGFNPLPHHR